VGSGAKQTDVSGAVRARTEHDPHGQVLLDWTDVAATLNDRKFTNYERDAASGLDYAQARYYQNARGRFTIPDPAGLRGADVRKPQSLNRYSYVNNVPVNFIDPTGRFNSPGPSNPCAVPGAICTLGLGNGGLGNADSFLTEEGDENGSGDGSGGEDQDNPVQDPGMLIDNANTEAERLLQNPTCRAAIEDVVFKAFLAHAGVKKEDMSATDLAYVLSDIASAAALISKLQGATRNIQATVYDPNFNATANESTNTITYYRGFFQQQIHSTIRTGNDPAYSYSNRSTKEMGQTSIHEGMHLLFNGATDARLGEAISGKKITGNEDERRDKGSKTISDFVRDKCK
jgi:RHS repeat-associated protein